MGSIRGFRCGQCRGEVLATAKWADPLDRREWTPPLLCCGQLLQPLDVGQILFAIPPPRRKARCPRCGYAVQVVVHPARGLTCLNCQLALQPSDAEADHALVGSGRRR
jgi:hypothetical protein